MGSLLNSRSAIRAMVKVTKRRARVPKRYTPKHRAAILAEAKVKRMTGNQVAAKYGIARITYYLWRRQAGARSWYGVGRRVAWTPTPATARVRLPLTLKRRVREIAARVVREEIKLHLDVLQGRRSGRDQETG